MKVGCLTVSDRASAGVYTDLGGPEIRRVAESFLPEKITFVSRIVPDEAALVSSALIQMADEEGCALILTTGGTGITPRDITPEATRAVLHKELPGFGEAMRMTSFARVPTAILSRAIAGVRGCALIINLPGKPAAIGECLAVLEKAILEALKHLRGEDPHAAVGRVNAH